jgi:hypothetical protein
MCGPTKLDFFSVICYDFQRLGRNKKRQNRSKQLSELSKTDSEGNLPGFEKFKRVKKISFIS